MEAADICGRQRYWGSSSQAQVSDLPLGEVPLMYKNEHFQDFNGANSIFTTSGSSGHFVGDEQQAFNPGNVSARLVPVVRKDTTSDTVPKGESHPCRTTTSGRNERKVHGPQVFAFVVASQKDKASIVGETISYVLELEKKLKALQTVAGTRSSLHRPKRRARMFMQNKAVQVELQALGAQAVVKVICMRTPGVLLRVLATLEDCKAQIVQSNISTLDSYSVLFFTIELSPETSTTTEDLIAALEIAACNTTNNV